MSNVEDQKIEVSPVVAAKTIRASFIYDAFNTSDRTIVDLEWVPGKTVAEYVGDLPEDVEYGYSVSGKVITREEATTISLIDSDSLVVTVVPQGKVGLIIGMVLAVAVASVFTLGAAGVLAGTLLGGVVGSVGWVTAGIAIATAGLTVAQGIMSLTQKADKGASDSPTYGIDGAKNTNTENTPVPLVYGTCRVAGNKVNIFVENRFGGSQLLYLQYVVSEGPVEAITDFRINDNPVSNFGDSITTEVRLGSNTQAPLQWFAESVEPDNVSVKLTQDYFYYTTNQAVDRLRLDVYFPNGTYHVTSKGKYESKSTTINAEYAIQNSDGSFTAWTSFDAGTAWYQLNSAAPSTQQTVTGLRLTVAMTGNDNEASTPYNVSVNCKGISGKGSSASSALLGPNGSLSASDFTVFGQDSGNIQNTVIFNGGQQKIVAATIYRTFEVVNLRSDEYYFNVDGGTIVAVEGFTTNSLTFTENTRTTLRRSITSLPLVNGVYQIRVSRQTAEATDTENVDTIYLSDVNLINTDPVAYNATAFYGIRAVLGTTINSEPQCSALVKGIKVAIYDRSGAQTDFRWSDNPADVALDILLNNERNQYAIDASRIDFAAFDDWRRFCASNNLVFNGVFDTVTTIWDALTTVTRVGHAGISLQGLLWSVVIEGPADPVMLITQDSVIKGSFQTQWTGRKDRANLVEVQYLDASDNYKRHSVFALDDSYLTNGDALVQNSVTMTGVTDAAQAQKEAWLTLNLGRYINQVISFQIPYQALGMAVGDVFLFQHNMPNWGNSAAVKSVTSQTQFTIDSPIEDTSGSWKLMALQSVVNLASGQVKAGSGNVIQVQTLTAPFWSEEDKQKPYYDPTVLLASNQDWTARILDANGLKVVFAGVEYDVRDLTIPENGVLQVTLDRNLPSAPTVAAQFFSIDVLNTASITLGSIDTATNTQAVTLTGWDTPMPSVIYSGMLLALGRENVTAKPFRLTKITYKEDHTREISANEYNASLYTDNPTDVPNYSGLSLDPLQVSNLTITLASQVSQGGAVNYTGTVGWRRPLSDQRIYAGAKVYVSRNYGDFVMEQDIPNPNDNVIISGNVDDNIRVKVVAYTQNGGSAAYDSAPMIAFVMTGETAVPDPVGANSLTAVGGIRLIALSWDYVNDSFINAYEIYESSTANVTDGYRVYYGMGNSFIRGGLDVNQTMYYWIRTVSNSGTYSAWSSSVSATTRFLLTDDLDEAIANTAKIAQALYSDISQPKAVDGDTLPDPANYPNDSVISYKGVLFKNSSGKWVQMVGAVSVDDSGKITSDILPSKLSDEQIAQLNLASIAGTLSPQAVSAINIAQTAGQLTADKISSVLSTAIVGKITDSQINSITAAQISTQITSDQIQGLEAAKLTSQITSTQIADGSISTPKLAAGAVTAGTLAAGSVTTSALAVASTSNLIANSCGDIDGPSINGWTAWRLSSSGPAASAMTVSSPSNSTGQIFNAAYLANYGSVAFGVTNLSAGVSSGYVMTGAAPQAPVQTGKTYIFSIYVSGSAWNTQLWVGWYDANKNWVSQQTDNVGDINCNQFGGAGSDITNYKRLWVRATAPANAKFAAVGVQSTAPKDIAASSCFIVVTKAQITECPPNTIEPPVWSAGGVTTIDGSFLKTGTIQAAKIAAGSITSAQIAAKTITANNIVSGSLTADVIAAGAIGATQIAANSIYAAALQANSVTAAALSAGAVTARSIAAGSIVTAALAVGGPTNLIQNSCISTTQGSAGWGAWNDGGGQAALFSNNAAEGNSYGWICVPAYGTLQNGKRIAINPTSRLPIISGSNYCVSAYIGDTGPLTAVLVCTYYDVNGNQITGWVEAQRAKNNGINNNDVSQYKRVWVFSKAPSNAVSMGIVLSGFNLTGSDVGGGPGMAFTKFQVCAVPDNSTEPPIFSYGMGVLIDGSGIQAGTVTADKIVANSITAAQIQAGAIGADQIAAGSIRASNLSGDTLIVKSAQIGNLVIGTSNMQDNSITVFAASWMGYNGGNFTVYSPGNSGAIVSIWAYAFPRDDGYQISTMRVNVNVNGATTFQTLSVNGGEGTVTLSFPLNIPSGNTTISVGVVVNGNSPVGYAGECRAVVLGRMK